MWPAVYGASFREQIRGRIEKEFLTIDDIMNIFPSSHIRSDQLGDTAYILRETGNETFKLDNFDGLSNISIRYDKHEVYYTIDTPLRVYVVKVLWTNNNFKGIEIKKHIKEKENITMVGLLYLRYIISNEGLVQSNINSNISKFTTEDFIEINYNLKDYIVAAITKMHELKPR